jgi:hypothetical protein
LLEESSIEALRRDQKNIINTAFQTMNNVYQDSTSGASISEENQVFESDRRASDGEDTNTASEPPEQPAEGAKRSDSEMIARFFFLLGR